MKEIRVMFSRFFTVSLMRFFWGCEITKKVFFSICHNVGRVRSAFTILRGERDPFVTGYIRVLESCIPVILFSRGFSQVIKPVFITLVVAVVNFFNWPFTGHIKPRQSSFTIVFPVNHNMTISLPSYISSPLTNPESMSLLDLPCEETSIGVISKNCFNVFMCELRTFFWHISAFVRTESRHTAITRYLVRLMTYCAYFIEHEHIMPAINLNYKTIMDTSQ